MPMQDEAGNSEHIQPTEMSEKRDDLQIIDQLKDNNVHDLEIDKDQFLEIIQGTFQKILMPLNPKISNCLNQLRFMYDHYIEQIENNQQAELQQSALQIQSMHDVVNEL